MRLARLIWLGLALALGAVALQFALYAARAAAFPFGLDYSEGLIWQQALWLGGPHLYGDIDVFPFLVCEYPPLYLLVLRAAAWVGPGLLETGRLISIGATLSACALLGLMVFRLCRLSCDRRVSAAAAGMAAILPLTLLPVISWAPLLRVDMLALALTYGGLFLAVLSFRRQALLYPALLAFVAAAYTKQIYLAGAAAMFPICLARAPKTTLRAYLAGLVLGLAVLAWLEWQTDGRFLRHILFYTAGAVDFGSALRQTLTWLLAYPVYAGLTVTALVLGWREVLSRRGGDRPATLLRLLRQDERTAWLGFLTLYLALTSLMLVASGKIGASRNYFIEWMCCWCLWIGWLAGLTLQRLRIGAGWFRLVMPALILVQLVPIGIGLHALQTQQFSAQRRADWGALLARVRQVPGPLLSDDMVLTLQAGREVTLEPAVLSVLSGLGVWDEQRLIRRLDTHYFGAVITAYDPGDPTFDARYPPAAKDALLRDYPQVQRFGDYRLRLPR
jgi:hypothetical protein